jgi:hypothetical protein
MFMRRANAGWLLSFHNYSNTPHIFRNHDAETTTCSSRHGAPEPTLLQQAPNAALEMRLHREKNPQVSPAMRRCSIALILAANAGLNQLDFDSAGTGEIT